jgi:PBSX family phage terminase large subunit
MTTSLSLEHRYRPRGAPLKLFACRADEVVLCGPAGTGKSRACLEKLHLMMLATPSARGLIVRKTLASLGSTALVTLREHVIPEALRIGEVKYYGGSGEQPPQYRYANGSVIVIGGLDKVTRIMSSEYDVIYVQEAIELTEDDWEMLTTRLRNGRISFQQLMADTNPSMPTHWLNQRMDAGRATRITCLHTDNPTLYDDFNQLTEKGRAYIAKLSALTGVRRARMFEGKWVAADGLVYDAFDPEIHLVLKPARPPEEWPRYWVIDFGFTNPFVLQCWVEDPDGRLILYREIYHTRRLVEDHAKKIMSIVSRPIKDYIHPAGEERYAYHGREWTEPQPRAIICDHDAEGRATFERETGLSTEPAFKTVTEGIQAVEARLRPAGDGRPRLLLRRDALVERDASLAEAGKPVCTTEEISGYVWARAADGRPQKEVPEKENDHGMDAMRYMVAYRDLAARPRVRWLS